MTASQVRVTPPPIIFYPVTFAGLSAFFAGLGWLGGHMVRIFSPSAIPTAHAVATGLWAPATLALYFLASAINQKGGEVNYAFGLLGGYALAITGANWLGYQVTVIGPFLGLAVLTSSIGASVALLAPLGFLGILLANANNRIRDFLLRQGK